MLSKLLAYRGTLRPRGSAHGVYRFEQFPASIADDYQQAVLWTGQPDAALSHETALNLLGLADVNPDRIHITVPVGARVRRQGGEHLLVYEENLRQHEVGWWEGIRCLNIVAAALQRELREGTPVFLLKGGVFIERVLDLKSRATKDLDTPLSGCRSRPRQSHRPSTCRTVGRDRFLAYSH